MVISDEKVIGLEEERSTSIEIIVAEDNSFDNEVVKDDATHISPVKENVSFYKNNQSTFDSPIDLMSSYSHDPFTEFKRDLRLPPMTWDNGLEVGDKSSYLSRQKSQSVQRL
ncbi:unnamed protein product [Cochlearia groenlandica]